MNKDNRIVVRTPVGDSERKETGETLTQGSIEAGIVSSLGLSSGVDDFFVESEHEIVYGLIRLQPQIYQDDLMRLCCDPISAQFGNDRLETLAETKLLTYNTKKTFIIFIGKKKAREKLEEDFSKIHLLSMAKKSPLHNKKHILETS